MGLSGCFGDFGVPEDARISCAEDADCPPDFRCAEVSRYCISSEAGAGVLPGFADTPTIEPKIGRAGTTITVSLLSDQPLATAPVVRLHEVPDAIFSVDLWDAVTRRTTQSYVLRGTEPEGVIGITVSLVNVEGGESTVSVGEVEIDFTPPELSSVLPTNGSTMVVTFSEAIDLVAASDAAHYAIIPEPDVPPLTIELAAPSKDGRIVTLITSLQTPGAGYAFSATKLADRAGNPIATSTEEILGFGAGGAPPIIISPVDHARAAGLSTTLEWLKVFGASAYSVEVALDTSAPDSDDFLNASLPGSPFVTQGTSLQVTFPEPKNYVWRVRADVTSSGLFTLSHLAAIDDRLYVWCPSGESCAFDLLRAGNKSEPMTSVAQAVATARALGLERVDIAARGNDEAYPDSVLLAGTMALYGGFDASFQAADPLARPTIIAAASGSATLLAYGATAVIDGLTLVAPPGQRRKAVETFAGDVTLQSCRISGGTWAIYADGNSVMDDLRLYDVEVRAGDAGEYDSAGVFITTPTVYAEDSFIASGTSSGGTLYGVYVSAKGTFSALRTNVESGDLLAGSARPVIGIDSLGQVTLNESSVESAAITAPDTSSFALRFSGDDFAVVMTDSSLHSGSVSGVARSVALLGEGKGTAHVSGGTLSSGAALGAADTFGVQLVNPDGLAASAALNMTGATVVAGAAESGYSSAIADDSVSADTTRVSASTLSGGPVTTGRSVGVRAFGVYPSWSGSTRRTYDRNTITSSDVSGSGGLSRAVVISLQYLGGGLPTVAYKEIFTNNLIVAGDAPGSDSIGIDVRGGGSASVVDVVIVTNNTVVSGSPTSGVSIGARMNTASGIRSPVADFTNNIFVNLGGTVAQGFFETGGTSDARSLQKNLLVDYPVLYADYVASAGNCSGGTHNCWTMEDELNLADNTTQTTGLTSGNLARSSGQVKFAAGGYALSDATPPEISKGGLKTLENVCGSPATSECGAVSQDLLEADRSCPTPPNDCYSLGAYEF